MSTKERFQNPNCGDTINLRLFTYNSNNLRAIKSVSKVDIYYLDSTLVSESNPDGRRLVETVDGSHVEIVDTGKYLLPLTVNSPLYVIGKYLDVWSVQFEDGECASAEVPNVFNVYPDLWFTSPVPPIYDFSFQFRPNKIVKGSKRYLIVQVTPNVPRGADLIQYYENLAIVSDIRISMEIACGECVPQEKDLRLVIDRELLENREGKYAYFFLDTTELDCAIYNVWFEISYGENTFISEKNQLQIFE